MSPVSAVTTPSYPETTSTSSSSQSTNLTIFSFLTRFNEELATDPSRELLSTAQQISAIRREQSLSLMKNQEEERKKRKADLAQIKRINAQAISLSSNGYSPSIAVLGPGPLFHLNR